MKQNCRPPLASINRKLSKAAQLLDAAAADLRDVGLNPRENIRKIGTMLVTVFEIQHEIYRREPSLAPAHVMEALGVARARPHGAIKKRSKRRAPKSSARRSLHPNNLKR